MTERDVLPIAPDHLLMLLYAADGPRTQPALAHALYGTPVHPVSDADESRRRATAIRNVQEALEELRRREYPVCSGSRGMWLARTSAEAFDTYRRNRARSLTEMHNNRGLLRAAQRMAAHEALGDVEQLFLPLGEAA